LDDVLDAVAGLVEGGFELAVWSWCFGGLMVK
jgi:hypothetical protein